MTALLTNQKSKTKFRVSNDVLERIFRDTRNGVPNFCLHLAYSCWKLTKDLVFDITP